MSAFLQEIAPRGPGREKRPSPRQAPLATSVEVAVLVILVVAALRLGSSLLVPVAIAALSSLLAMPPVRWLNHRGVPGWLGAALVVGGGVIIAAGGVYVLAKPATEWLDHVPDSLPTIESKVRLLARPFTKIEQTAREVSQAAGAATGAPRAVTVATPSWIVRLTGGTASLITSIITIVFLTYFLASTNRLFSRKLVRLVPGHDDQKVLVNALSEVGAQTSRYLVLTSAISLGVGIATCLVLAAFGLPNALLLGAVTGVLNLVPYVGGLVSAALIAGAGFVAFEGLERTLFMLAAALAIHTLSGNLVTPAVLGRRLPLNPVALFACLIFWSWTWGIAGAIMAVPLTVMFKVFCEHVPRLRPMGVLLDS